MDQVKSTTNSSCLAPGKEIRNRFLAPISRQIVPALRYPGRGRSRPQSLIVAAGVSPQTVLVASRRRSSSLRHFNIQCWAFDVRCLHSVQSSANACACANTSAIASSHPSGGYLYLLKSCRIKIRIFARTLSRNCQSSACASRLRQMAKHSPAGP